MLASTLATLALSAPALPRAADLTDGLPLFALAALAWLFTYALHSTLMLGSAWLATRRMADARAGLRERVWKFAVVAAFVTASVQVGMGFEPLGGRLPLRRSTAATSHTSPALALIDTSALRERATSQPFQAASRSSTWYVLLAKQAIDKLGTKAVPLVQSLLQAPGNSLAALNSIGDEKSRLPEARSKVPTDAVAANPWFASLGEWTQWAFATCALGALAGVCLFGLLWLRLNGCLRDRVALEHGLLADKLRELCRRAGIRRRVRLSVAPSLGAPISMGLFQAEICVPPRVLLELSEEEQEVLLAHELAHVVRRDPLWLAACRLCEGVFFFQPLNRVARHEIEDCAEFLSDAWAVRQTGLRFSLASCLTRIAEWIVGERRVLPAPAMAHGRSRLRHRVELLLDESAAQNVDRRPRWLGIACTGFCAALVAVVPCVSASEDSLAIGDGGNLPFLPGRDACAESPDCGKCTETAPAPEESAKSNESSVAIVDETAAAPGDTLDLSAEIESLRAEFVLLRDGTAAVQFENVAEALKVAAELKRMEMTLAHLREVNARIDLLRAALKSAAIPAANPVREARSKASPLPQPANQTLIPSVNLEETSK